MEAFHEVEQLYEIKSFTRKVVLDWKNHKGWAPKSASLRLDKAMFDWIIELTDCLSIWESKGDQLTDGELILAYTNLGSLVENWLKLFYCIHYKDYQKNPILKGNKTVEPGKTMLQQLKEFSIGKLWEKGDHWYIWVEKIQQRRNSIHAFNYRNIGDSQDFFEDLKKYKTFIEFVNNRFPPAPSEAEYYFY